MQQALELLPIGKPQEALDILKNENSAEGHYLKALALYRLELRDAAKEQLDKAMAKAPNNLKYHGFMLRMSLMNENDGATSDKLVQLDELLQMYEQNKSSGAIALFGATGFAKKGDVPSAMKAFRTSVALSDEIPEFLPEMLIFAMRGQMGPEALTVLEKLEKRNPNDPILARQRVGVLLMLKEYDDAIRNARDIYKREKESEDSAMLYGRALASAPGTAERDKALQGVIQRYPAQEQLLLLQATYLARSNRLDQAVKMLNKVIDGKPGDEKYSLLHIAIDLPLEAGNAEIAEQQIDRYRSLIKPPLLMTYYEGRLQMVRKDYKAATATLTKVVEAGKDNTQGSLALAKEALIWLQQIQYNQQVSNAMQKAATEATSEETPEKGAAGDSEKTEKPSSKKNDQEE